MDQNKSPTSTDKSILKLRNSLIGSFLFLVVMVAIFSAQTYAYFWDSTTTTNQIKSGYLDVEFFEVQDGEQETIHTTPVRFLPGTTVNKTVKIVNSGDLPVYVRIKIEKTVTNNENELPDGWEELISCKFHLDDESTPDVKEKLWTYRDGYYYYYSKVDPQAITTSLFDEVYFSTAIGNELANTTLEFKVICQAVQANGNSGDPLTAWGWPDDSNANP